MSVKDADKRYMGAGYEDKLKMQEIWGIGSFGRKDD